MSVLNPGFTATHGAAVGDWRPTRYTPSLTGSEDFVSSEGDKLVAFAERFWSIPAVAKLELDPWQPWLIRHVLERYPEDWPVEHLRGQLRFRQVVISMGRQNGKSLIGSLFVIYFLALHVRGPNVVSVASVERQAKIVYNRIKYAIENNPALLRDLRPTSTRGIHRRDGTGQYLTLPADEESAQGEPVTGGLYDELHLGLAGLWDALVLGQQAQDNSILVGITTAGDDGSHLLIRLYAEADAAIEGADERFGAFIWEGDDDTLTEANVIAANPAVACGRVPLDRVMAAARKMWVQPKDESGMTGRDRVIRYTLNRFVEGVAGGWASLVAWNACAGTVELDPAAERIVYSIERTDSWEFTSIEATVRRDDGTLVTELVATIEDADVPLLLKVCDLLAARGACTFAMDRFTLDDLGKSLEDAGHDVWRLTGGEMMAAAQHAKSVVARRAVKHAGDPLVRIQFASAVRRDVGESWRISRSLSNGPTDAIIATVEGLYIATVQGEKGMQLG